jgi:hypothetical protein
MGGGRDRCNNGKISISSLKNRIRELEALLEKERKNSDRLEKRIAAIKQGLSEEEIDSKVNKTKTPKKAATPAVKTNGCPKCDDGVLSKFEIEAPHKILSWMKCNLCKFKEKING